VGASLADEDLMLFWAAALAVYVLAAAFGAFMLIFVFPGPKVDEVGNTAFQEEDFGADAAEPGDEFLRFGWASLRFKDPRLELKWQREEGPGQIAHQSLMLAVVTCFFLLYHTFRLYNSGSCRPIEPWLEAIHFGVLFLVLLGTLTSWMRPTPFLYWSIFVFYSFYILSLNLPPWTWSCYDLRQQCGAVLGFWTWDDFRGRMSASDISHLEGVKSKIESYWYVEQAVETADCSLHGRTSMQFLVTWLLLLPYLVSGLEIMNLGWIWIGVYLSWSQLWYLYTEEDVFDNYDVMVRTVILVMSLVLSINIKYWLEKNNRKRFLSHQAHRQSSQKMFAILGYMMPEHVIGPMFRRMLRDPTEPIADHINRVSILFILISNFEEFTSELIPRELLGFLNQQFSRIDEILATDRVTKIETVGEEYVACVGIEQGQGYAAYQDGLIRLLHAAGEILKGQRNWTMDNGKVKEVQYKMGVHSGPIVAGVIGTKLPRYRLFGDTINTAARMMQKGEVGHLQFGKETFEDLPAKLQAQVNDGVGELHGGQVKLRGEVEMKGKGAVLAYTFKPNGTDAASPGEGSKSRVTITRRGTLCGALVAPGAAPPANEVDDGAGTSMISNRESPQKQEQCTKWLEEALDVVEVETENDLKPELAAEWGRDRHIKFCQMMRQRFAGEAVLIILLTSVELTFLVVMDFWRYEHPILASHDRWAVFLHCRLIMVACSIFWCYLSEASRFIDHHSRAVPWMMLMTYCVYLSLMFMSYNAFSFSGSDGYRRRANYYQNFKAPKDHIITLVFVIVFFATIRRHNFQFNHALIFVPLALFLANVVDIAKEVYPSLAAWESMYSLPGKSLVVAQALLSLAIAYEEDKQGRIAWKMERRVKITQERTQHILRTLMPPLVVDELRTLPLNAPPPSHKYRHATIAQSDLCGFTKLAATRPPKEVVTFMGDLFGAFDVLTDKHGVYKVETIGDAYIAGMAEGPLTKTNLPVNVVLFSLDMVRAVDDWARNMGVTVACRVGVHYGECIGGIVGFDMQRYHLFGDLLSVLEVLESTGIEGRTQVSKACKEECERQLREEADGIQESRQEEVTFTKRPDATLLTSKGEAHSYDEVGGETYLVESNLPLRPKV
jgi:class 3 adenylate cyclase